MWRQRKRWLVGAFLVFWATGGAAQTDFSARVKWFGTAAALAEHDLQRNLSGTPAYDQNYDLRLMFRQAFSGISLQVEHATTLVTGDSLNFPTAPGTILEQSPDGDERRLMDIIAMETDWSPDGKYIAFASDHEGFRGLYVLDIAAALEGGDGNHIQRISSTRAGENCPDWSSDGTWITFASWRGGNGEIYVIDVADFLQGTDGSSLQRLTVNLVTDEFPAWRP